MVDSDQVLELVKEKGPVVPTDLTSDLNSDSFLVGALLSELLARKALKKSHAKIGGSPVYYAPGQNEKLERLYDYLNEKNRRAYDLLKEKVVLIDDTLDPLAKTCMRELKDFAVPYRVNYRGKEFLFWRWHVANKEEVKGKTKEVLLSLFPKKDLFENVETIPPEKPLEFETNSSETSLDVENPIEVPKVEKIDSQQELNSEVLESAAEVNKKIIEAEEKLKEQSFSDAQTKLVEDEFLDEIKSHFNSKGIIINDYKVVKKKSDIDLIVTVPSPIGDLKYYCKARNKKRSNDGDIASAYLEGQLKNLPSMYFSKGDVPKKVEPLLETKFKGIKIIKWE